jgi:hypothetical protein
VVRVSRARPVKASRGSRVKARARDSAATAASADRARPTDAATRRAR